MNQPHIASAALGIRHVFLRDMVLPASIGVYSHERDARQRVRVNVDLAVEDDSGRPASRPAIGRDELGRVVNYEHIAEAVRAVVQAGHVALVETMAERIAESCLFDPRIRSVRVRVEKLDIFPDAASAGVEIERQRG